MLALSLILLVVIGLRLLGLMIHILLPGFLALSLLMLLLSLTRFLLLVLTWFLLLSGLRFVSLLFVLLI